MIENRGSGMLKGYAFYRGRAHMRAALVRAGQVGAALAARAAAATPAHSQTATEQFFRGKSVNIYVGSSAGGGYDTYARLLARHLGRHIPGQPTIVVQNMPGAGSNKATSYIFNV